MKNILLHGLLQTPSSWKVIQSQLQEKQIDSQCPNLFQMTQEKTYQNLFNEFTNFCNNQKGKLNLCGLSFGGILALEYAKKFPEKVNSLIIINVPYTIPKILFQIQNIIFHFMPKKVFQKVGMTKKEFRKFLKSMSQIEIKKNIEKISCPCFILNGSSDYSNKKSAKHFQEQIAKSKVQIISNSSHEVNVDNPFELSKIIIDVWK